MKASPAQASREGAEAAAPWIAKQLMTAAEAQRQGHRARQFLESDHARYEQRFGDPYDPHASDATLSLAKMEATAQHRSAGEAARAQQMLIRSEVRAALHDVIAEQARKQRAAREKRDRGQS